MQYRKFFGFQGTFDLYPHCLLSPLQARTQGDDFGGRTPPPSIFCLCVCVLEKKKTFIENEWYIIYLVRSCQIGVNSCRARAILILSRDI